MEAKLKERFELEIASYVPDGNLSKSIVDLMSIAYNMALQDTWVDVSSGDFPDQNTKCMVFVSEGFTKTYYEVWYWPDLKQWWCEGKQVENVTQWQPMPPQPNKIMERK